MEPIPIRDDSIIHDTLKKLICALLSLAMLFSLTSTVFAADSNMDGGGGDMGQGTSENSWTPGRDGVRVTIIRDSDNTPVSTSVDFSNGTNGDIQIHFQYQNKISYKNGATLAPKQNGYVSHKPSNAMPTIISDDGGNNIAAIRSYFCRSGTIQDIADATGFDYNTLINGNYKILVEPIAYHPKERVKKRDCNRKYRFDCEHIHIAVISSQPRMGATTAAIGLSSWLAAVGASVSYVEENGNEILSTMAAAYEVKPDEDGWMLDGVHYGAVPAGAASNFIIHDIGHLPDLNETAKGADLLLVVCGTKPYELSNSMMLLHRLETVDAYVLCPFTHEKVRDDYAAILRNDFHKVLFLDYQPEPTDGMSNAKQYQIMMAKYITGEYPSENFE